MISSNDIPPMVPAILTPKIPEKQKNMQEMTKQ